MCIRASALDFGSQSMDFENFYSVPYSDHSSYQELIEFVKAMKPRTIFPLINERKQVKNENSVNFCFHGRNDMSVFNDYLCSPLSSPVAAAVCVDVNEVAPCAVRNFSAGTPNVAKRIKRKNRKTQKGVHFSSMDSNDVLPSKICNIHKYNGNNLETFSDNNTDNARTFVPLADDTNSNVNNSKTFVMPVDSSNDNNVKMFVTPVVNSNDSAETCTTPVNNRNKTFVAPVDNGNNNNAEMFVTAADNNNDNNIETSVAAVDCSNGNNSETFVAPIHSSSDNTEKFAIPVDKSTENNCDVNLTMETFEFLQLDKIAKSACNNSDNVETRLISPDRGVKVTIEHVPISDFSQLYQVRESEVQNEETFADSSGENEVKNVETFDHSVCKNEVQNVEMFAHSIGENEDVFATPKDELSENKDIFFSLEAESIPSIIHVNNTKISDIYVPVEDVDPHNGNTSRLGYHQSYSSKDLNIWKPKFIPSISISSNNSKNNFLEVRIPESSEFSDLANLEKNNVSAPISLEHSRALPPSQMRKNSIVSWEKLTPEMLQIFKVSRVPSTLNK